MGQLTSRQQIITDEVTDPRMRNWLCANMAMRDTAKTLSRGVHHIIARMHKRMLSTMEGYPTCRFNCSRRAPQWCETCQRWKYEIMLMCQPEFSVNWSRLNSAQFHNNPYEVGRAFIPRAHRLYYKSADFHEDIRFSLSFLENSTEVRLSKALCERAWQCRGKVQRKQGLMRLSSQDLERHVEILVELLEASGVSVEEEVVDRLNTLQSDTEEKSDGGCVIM